MRKSVRTGSAIALAAALVAACGGRGGSDSQTASDPGISEDSIVLGGTFARSGPLAVAGQAGDGGQAAVAEINADGGIDGREVTYLVEDDQYDPTVTVEKVRKLVEQDQVFALVGSVGTSGQLATRDYLAQHEVPSLFLYTGAAAWDTDYDEYPWTMTGVASYPTIGRAFGRYLASAKPNAKVGVLMQNDDVGGDQLEGFKEAIAGTGITIIKEESYEVSIPTTAPLVGNLQRAGADTFLNIGSPQGASQALDELNVLGWKPLTLLPGTGVSQQLLVAAGAAAEGVVSEGWVKLPTMPEFASDPEVAEYEKWMKSAVPDVDPNSRIAINGYVNMGIMFAALKAMKEPTRAALLASAQSLDTTVPMLLPGIGVKTGDGDPLPIETLQMLEFKDDGWNRIGDPIDTSSQ